MSIMLYPHNEDAYQAALRRMEACGKAAVIHPTGTGKSFLAFRLAEDHPQAAICWLAPSQYIFQTQMEAYEKNGGLKESLHKVTFLTYARLMEGGPFIHTLHPDYIILDEFHRCGAKGWGKCVVRFLEAHPGAKVFGLSATNIRYLDGQRDMAEELLDGQIASRMGVGEAIGRGILPAPVYVVSLYAYEGELRKWEQRVGHSKDSGMRSQNEKLLEKLRRSLEKADGPEAIFARHLRRDGKYLVFCANRGHLKEMVGLSSRWFGALDASPHIYQAYHGWADSARQFERFCEDTGSHLKLLYSIDMFNEGIHVPGVDGVVLLRPTRSPIVYFQQVGRALCAAAGKPSAQPVVVDLVNNFEGLYSIDSLREGVRSALTQASGGTEGPDVWDRFRIIDEVRECRQLFEQLRQNLTAPWEAYYEEARRYYEAHGDLGAPKRYRTEGGLCLGGWLLTQRRVRAGTASGVLTQEQIARLDEIGMVWEGRRDAGWEEGYQELKRYRAEHGHVAVAARYVTPQGYPLGRWVASQRLIRKGRQKGVLTDERLQKLDALGFVWNRADECFGRYYAAAREYYTREGNLAVPAKYTTDEGVHLGDWVDRMRRQKSSLSQEKIKALDGIGMVWEGRQEKRWEEMLRLAKQFYEEHGHLEVPAGYEIEGVRLGRWVHVMRSVKNGATHSNYRLTKERVAQLEGVGMRWERTGADKEGHPDTPLESAHVGGGSSRRQGPLQ